uniref:anoctamin-1 isoform X4 n=1 Tax=Vespula vulgaris TaxID=7454 RepID=UPI00213F3D33|nr:anoctamin-1 isoform X4 [Vespula vulgaris]
MEEEDEVFMKLTQQCESHTPALSVYHSLQDNLNYGSQQTIYRSPRNTLYEDAISMNSLYSRTSPQNNGSLNDDDILPVDNETNEAIMNGSCSEINQSDSSTRFSLFFKDKIRSVDFVLVWDDFDGEAKTYRSVEHRRVFETNLQKEGLELEYEPVEANGLHFIKIHAPREVLRRYAEILKLRLPMKEIPELVNPPTHNNVIINEVNSFFKRIMKHYYVDTTIFPAIKHKFTAIYSRDKEYLFDLDSPNFFTSAIRSRIVQFILDRTRFAKTKNDDFAFGIERLISERSYVAAYPLHDIAVAMAAVLGVVLYRMSVLTALSFYGHPMVTSYAILFTTATAATINLGCIIVFNWVYVWLAEYLTEIELLRTQTEFDDSLTLKIYLLEFVNYYASIFYIAFFKGKFVGYPGNYNRFFHFRQEECGPGGCLMELCIQLSIIMIGKQAMNTILEMLYPLFFKWLNTLKVHVGARKVTKEEKNGFKKDPQWIKDYKLVQFGPRSLFPEYLEMVLQYGFVTIFVAAFPLAPFFALLNNVLEMRLDAKKLLVMFRRPVGQRVTDIGIWYRILDSISKISVITNGFIIAFTSNFIPRLVYLMSISDKYSLEGFLDYSLAKFNISDFENNTQPMSVNNQRTVEICRYPDFREPPWSKNKYQYTITFWHILAARLAFIVVFENIVALVMILVRWCIPDISPKLRDKIRREAYITNEIIIHQEALRASVQPHTSTEEPQQYVLSNESADRWNRVMRGSLSNSEFDLEVHGSPVSPVSTTSRVGPAAL